MMRPKIMILTGPTGIGKTKLSIRLARELSGEIVSADSMQIYRRLDIGTGKVTEGEKQGIPHHLIDIKEPDEEYSVGQYVQDARAVFQEIFERNHLPIVVGGTGLYLNALVNGLNFGETAKSPDVRAQWKGILAEKGEMYVYNFLQSVDPVAAAKINPHDTKRVIRAIEIHEMTGQPKSIGAGKSDPGFDYQMFVLTQDRETLYRKINLRVEKMFADGLLKEVETLLPYRDCQSMKAIGYRECAAYLCGEAYDALEDLIADVQKNTRRYAKRQITFFKWMQAEKTFVDWEKSQDIGAYL